jgi:hypothetical protein
MELCIRSDLPVFTAQLPRNTEICTPLPQRGVGKLPRKRSWDGSERQSLERSSVASKQLGQKTPRTAQLEVVDLTKDKEERSRVYEDNSDWDMYDDQLNQDVEDEILEALNDQLRKRRKPSPLPSQISVSLPTIPGKRSDQMGAVYRMYYPGNETVFRQLGIVFTPMNDEYAFCRFPHPEMYMERSMLMYHGECARYLDSGRLVMID